jgi:DNA-directed RNA polymerase subunit RPC12/RpoP
VVVPNNPYALGRRRKLAELTTKQLIDKYTGADPSYSANWYRVHPCTECHRQFAGSEQQKFGVEQCPACAHELRGGHFAGLFTGCV